MCGVCFVAAWYVCVLACSSRGGVRGGGHAAAAAAVLSVEPRRAAIDDVRLSIVFLLLSFCDNCVCCLVLCAFVLFRHRRRRRCCVVLCCDAMPLQEMGLTDVDLAYIGVKNAAQRKALKMAATGFVELMLHVEISGFFNYNSELVSTEKKRKAPELSVRVDAISFLSACFFAVTTPAAL